MERVRKEGIVMPLTGFIYKRVKYDDGKKRGSGQRRGFEHFSFRMGISIFVVQEKNEE
jgi:hypothetical protein